MCDSGSHRQTPRPSLPEVRGDPDPGGFWDSGMLGMGGGCGQKSLFSQESLLSLEGPEGTLGLEGAKGRG